MDSSPPTTTVGHSSSSDCVSSLGRISSPSFSYYRGWEFDYKSSLKPKVAERILWRHPFNESKRAYVVPQQVEELLKCYWPGNSGKAREELPPLKDIRERCIKQLEQMRPDSMRRLNPTPYKVNVSAKLYDFIHFLWLNEAPVGELQ